MIGYVAVDLYLGRCGRECGDRFLHLGRCGRVCRCRSLLGTLW